MIRLAVQIQPEAVAELLAGHSARPELCALLDEARAAGLALAPMHPGTSDPELRTWFFAQAETPADATACAARLLRHAPVLSAYPKPPDELP